MKNPSPFPFKTNNGIKWTPACSKNQTVMPNSRQIALDILLQVKRYQQPVDHWLATMAVLIDQLGRSDRALVHALVYGTLRWQMKLDHIIDHLADKPGKIDERVRIILRMALFQIHHMDRIPISAAVNTAVELAKQNKRKWASGFVNGLLRRATASGNSIRLPDETSSPECHLSVAQSLPVWLAERWIGRWGKDEAQRLAKAINTIPDITIRANTLKTDRDGLMAAIADSAEIVRKTMRSPDGVVVSKLDRPFHQWDIFQQGWFQVQDEAAQLVTHLLDPQPGHYVWDTCAGLGTKTGHIGQRLRNRGSILATDMQPAKLQRLQEEMVRLGVTTVSTRVLDLTGLTTRDDLPKFDRILVDAPCSGLGVLQKNPDGKWRLSADDLIRFQKRQLELLERTAPHLRTGGILVYAVCSFEPEENESVINAFLQKHPGFAINPPENIFEATFGDTLTSNGWISTQPHRHGMDGFFAAALIRHT